MDQIIANLVADAEILTNKNSKKYVAFRAAVNRQRLNRSTGKKEKSTKYYRCYYWLNTGIAEYLTKGTKVHLSGEKDASAWNDSEGKARVNHLFFAEAVEFLSSAKQKNQPESQDQQPEKQKAGSSKTGKNKTGAGKPVEPEAVNMEEADDLPF